MIGCAVPGWRLLGFVALRRLTPLGMILFTTGLMTSLVLLVHLAPARTFTVTVTVVGLDYTNPLPISAIEIAAGNCLVTEATPSPSGSAAFALPAGDYTVTAGTNADGRMAGWTMYEVPMHLDRDLDVAIRHDMAPPSDLFSMREDPPARCPAR